MCACPHTEWQADPRVDFPQAALNADRAKHDVVRHGRIHRLGKLQNEVEIPPTSTDGRAIDAGLDPQDAVTNSDVGASA